jgi:nicotinate-nucleotide pyrophosphorylase
MKKELAIKKYYNQKNKLTLKNSTYLRQLNTITNFILLEDLNNIGDITTDKLITKNSPAQAILIAKQDGILAGIEEISYITKKYKIKTKIYKKDGDGLKNKDKIMTYPAV